MPRRELRLDLLLAAGVLVYNLLFLGHLGLFDVDEAIFAEATREMVTNRDWVTPTYNGGTRWDKPPFIYWAMAPSQMLGGPTSFAARFTSATAGALLALLLALFGRAVFGGAAGRWAGVVMATCLHGFALSHMSLTDMTLALLMAAGWICLFWSAERQSPWWFLAAAVALGLATLTKGPVALVLPGLTWLVYLLGQRRLLSTLDATHCWWGFLLYAAVVAPWCWLIWQRHGLAFFESFLGYHNLDRLTRTQSGHGGPFFTFVVVVIVGLTPWGGCLSAAFGDVWRRGRGDLAGRALTWCALWVLLVVGLFSLSQTKLPNYIAPCYPAAALLAGYVAAQAAAGESRRWGWIFGPTLVGLALTGVGLISLGTWLPGLEVLRRELPGAVVSVGRGPTVAGLAMALAAAVAGLHLFRCQPRRLVTATAAVGAVCGLALWLGVAPVVYRWQQGTLRVMTQVASAEVERGAELATLNLHQPSVAYYGRRTFTRWTEDPTDPLAARRLAKRFARERPLLMITRTRRVGDLLRALPHQVWAARDGWLLVGNYAPPPGWALPPSPWREADLRRQQGSPGSAVNALAEGRP